MGNEKSWSQDCINQAKELAAENEHDKMLCYLVDAIREELGAINSRLDDLIKNRD